MDMGSPLSPVIANFYMEDFENRALQLATYRPTCWYRYVDDFPLTLTEWTCLADVSGQPISPIFEGQAVQEDFSKESSAYLVSQLSR